MIYTEWRSPDFKEPMEGLLNRQQFQPFDIPFPLLTQEVLNTSQVFIYAKNRQLILENGGVLRLVENIHEVSNPMTASYYLFPGRSGLSIDDYGSHSVSISAFLRPNVITCGGGVLRLAPGTNVSTTANVTVPEMANKTPAFYRDFMKELVKYRVVIIKGNVAGRMAAVDMKDYAAVKAAFNLKD
ncbi:MAG: hypothetical protein EAY79_13020 [Runella slithyformis]|nr:MAG: hypothetical protein EAY79_13020 [Runella slithyformis]TAF00452.1 MAG: hypothetical protein EAZ80_03770 [Runella slithyformis]